MKRLMRSGMLEGYRIKTELPEDEGRGRDDSGYDVEKYETVTGKPKREIR